DRLSNAVDLTNTAARRACGEVAVPDSVGCTGELHERGVESTTQPPRERSGRADCDQREPREQEPGAPHPAVDVRGGRRGPHDTGCGIHADGDSNAEVRATARRHRSTERPGEIGFQTGWP